MLKPDFRTEVASTAMFCPFDGCKIAYFDSFDRVATIDMLVRPVYPKDLTAPLCPCFGLTLDDIQADVDEGVVSRTRDAVQKAKSPAARCSTMSPTGTSCVQDIQRCYRQIRGPE